MMSADCCYCHVHGSTTVDHAPDVTGRHHRQTVCSDAAPACACSSDDGRGYDGGGGDDDDGACGRKYLACCQPQTWNLSVRFSATQMPMSTMT